MVGLNLYIVTVVTEDETDWEPTVATSQEEAITNAKVFREELGVLNEDDVYEAYQLPECEGYEIILRNKTTGKHSYPHS